MPNFLFQISVSGHADIAGKGPFGLGRWVRQHNKELLQHLKNTSSAANGKTTNKGITSKSSRYSLQSKDALIRIISYHAFYIFNVRQ